MAGRHRIAHVLAWPTVAGTEIAALRLMQTVGAGQIEHTAFCAGDESETRALLARAGVDTLPYRPCELSLRRPFPFVLASLELARRLRASRASLVHCSDVMAALHSVVGARIARLPVICHVRNPHDDIQRRYRHLLNGVTRFVFVSRHARERFPLRLAERRSVVLYDGVKAEEIPHYGAHAAVCEELGLPAESRLVGMVGRLALQKDHATFLLAARRVVESVPEASFLIIGDKSGSAQTARRHAELVHLAQELGLGRRVIFTGFRSDTANLFAAMDVAVLATHFEGFGLVVVEAMLQGCPVVATGVGGVLEIITDGETGLLHRHQDAEHLADQVVLLLLNQERARAVGLAGQRFARERFSVEAFAAGMAGVYRSLLPSSQVAAG